MERWKDEIIALYLSHSHTSHPLFSAQPTWNEKVGQKKERKRVSIQSGTPQQKFSQMSKGIPYWVRVGLSFVILGIAASSMSGLVCSVSWGAS
jgi:hypothetical protein